MIKQQKKATKEEENVHCLQNHFFHIFFWAYGSRFFSFIFPVSWILSGKINCQIFFVISMLIFCSLCWWLLKKKIFDIFLGGDRSWTKNWWKFWFWSFGFGSLDLGVLILDFGPLHFGSILEFPGSLGSSWGYVSATCFVLSSPIQT